MAVGNGSDGWRPVEWRSEGDQIKVKRQFGGGRMAGGRSEGVEWRSNESQMGNAYSNIGWTDGGRSDGGRMWMITPARRPARHDQQGRDWL